MQYFVVNGLEKDITIEYMGIQRDIPLIWADGMVGIMPVFDSKKNAEKYAKGNGVTEIKIINKEKLSANCI